MSYTVVGYDPFKVAITGGTATAAGGQAAIPNPEGVDLIIADAWIVPTANSTGATNLTIGTASAGTVAASSMLGATAMAAASGSVLHLVYHGTAVGASATPAKWGSADYINVSASATAAGLTALLFVKYYRIE